MNKSVWRNRRGFTLIEVIVVAAIIAILAGILVPMIFNQIDESKKTKAAGDVKTLQQAVASVRANTLRWPTWSLNGTACEENVDNYQITANAPVLTGISIGTGIVAFKEVFAQPKSSTLATTCYMKYDNPAAPTWSGPYLADDVGLDPWGHSYIIYVANLNSSVKAPASRWGWVISAGPDGVIDTKIDASATLVTSGDDIGIRIQD